MFYVLVFLLYSAILIFMNPEERSLLERTYKMTEENNEILKVMRRTARFSLALRATYWIVIIGLSIGALYFIQPYIDFVTGALGVNSGSESSIKVLQDLLK
jgi:hypothetical protein